jgi:hypothetical protein
MMNETIFTPILPLMGKLQECVQREFGWIYSRSGTLVTHDNPEIRKQIQKSVDAYIPGLLLVYLFALWEEYVDRQIERDWLPADKSLRLNAFRHIRHSFAHGFNGNRANKCRIEFESIMSSNQPFPNLPWDNDKIDLTKSQVAIDCQRFMEDLAKELIGRIANDNRP